MKRRSRTQGTKAQACSGWLIAIISLSIGWAVVAQAVPEAPKRRVVAVFDRDHTLKLDGPDTWRDGFSTPYVLVKLPKPPSTWLPRDVFNAAPERLEITQYDFEKISDGSDGLGDVRSLLGRIDQNGRAHLGSTAEITLSDGRKIIPGFYRTDANQTYEYFRSDTEQSRSRMLDNFRSVGAREPRLWAREPFTLMRLLLSHRAQQMADIKVIELSAQGHDPELVASGYAIWKELGLIDTAPHELFAPEYGRTPSQLAYRQLNHVDFDRYWPPGGMTADDIAKAKATDIFRVLRALNAVPLAPGTKPHLLIFAENEPTTIRAVRERIEAAMRSGVLGPSIEVMLINMAPDHLLLEPVVSRRERIGRNQQYPTEGRLQLLRISEGLPELQNLRTARDADFIEVALSQALSVPGDIATASVASAWILGAKCGDVLRQGGETDPNPGNGESP